MKLYVISNSNIMADFILDEFKDDPNVVQINFKQRKNALTASLKWIRLKMGNPRGLFDDTLFEKKFLDEISKIQPEDKVLLWSIENLKNTMLIANEIRSKNIQSFLWNPMLRVRRNNSAEKYKRKIKEYGIGLSTFDPYDSKMLDCRLMPQVHRAVEMPAIEHPEFDVFFVGQLKGREEPMSRLIKEFRDNDISYFFHLIYGRHDTGDVAPEIKECIKDELMSYPETLANINKSRCLLDLTQKGQQGLTLRPIEAMMYKKKLITNNPAIKNEPFYNPDNIWILDDPDEKRSVADFLKNVPYTPVPADVEQRYHIRPWLDALWHAPVASAK